MAKRSLRFNPLYTDPERTNKKQVQCNSFEISSNIVKYFFGLLVQLLWVLERSKGDHVERGEVGEY